MIYNNQKTYFQSNSMMQKANQLKLMDAPEALSSSDFVTGLELFLFTFRLVQQLVLLFGVPLFIGTWGAQNKRN